MKQDADILSPEYAHMQIRLYIEEDAMARTLVQGLRARGVDLTTVVDEGMKGRDDNEQLERATQQRRVIYTFNVGDFCKLHRDYAAAGKSHAGIIVVYRQRYSVGEQIRRLIELIGMKSPEEMRDRLNFL